MTRLLKGRCVVLYAAAFSRFYTVVGEPARPRGYPQRIGVQARPIRRCRPSRESQYGDGSSCILDVLVVEPAKWVLGRRPVRHAQVGLTALDLNGFERLAPASIKRVVAPELDLLGGRREGVGATGPQLKRLVAGLRQEAGGDC
jgi:hypothetical protein